MEDEPKSKKIKLDPPAPTVEASATNIIEPSTQKKSLGFRQREIDVGITEYMNNSEPIYGILKQRFSDFQVHEISTDDYVVKLTSVEPPVSDKKECDVSVLEDSVREELQRLHAGTSEEPILIPVEKLDKVQRKAIHCAIKSLFPNLDSNTVKKEQSKFIKIAHKSDNQIVRSNWPADRPPYTYFVLYKENKDTMEAINIVSSKLRIKPSNFGYAGTKDRRAKTSQLVSIKKVLPQKLLHLNKTLKQICIGNILFKDKPLKLGDLKGNRFSIVLREVNSSLSQAEPVLQSVKNNGFINYFGMQRFGTSEVPTQSIGKALLRSQWQDAIDLILKPKHEDKYFSECKNIWLKTKDAATAYGKLLPFKRSSIEGHLLLGLMKSSKNDLIGALNFVPRNTRLMYVHSYQSYIWNIAASFRVKNYGLKPVVGDLVYCAPSDSEDCDKKSHEVKVLSENDLKLNFTIYDVVLPLPGYDVIYPENEVKDLYKKLLEEDNLDMNNMKVKVKSYSLSGSYRKIVVQPNEFTWSFHQYQDPTVSLIQSDIDEMNKVKTSEASDGPHRALKVHISLPSSSYATMALREITKSDTSSDFQKSLNS